MDHDRFRCRAQRLAPEDAEVEITPEMIEAGAKELTLFDYEFESFERGVERIFSAMIDAAPSGRAPLLDRK
jgi:hypothetical protein